MPDYDPLELVAWLIEHYPKHRQRGPWQFAIAEFIQQDYIQNRDPLDTEQAIRAGLAAFQRSQQWREGKIENLAKWLSERLFLSPPPEHEGQRQQLPTKPAIERLRDLEEHERMEASKHAESRKSS